MLKGKNSFETIFEIACKAIGSRMSKKMKDRKNGFRKEIFLHSATSAFLAIILCQKHTTMHIKSTGSESCKNVMDDTSMFP
jgi:hypothetical protein